MTDVNAAVAEPSAATPAAVPAVTETPEQKHFATFQKRVQGLPPTETTPQTQGSAPADKPKEAITPETPAAEPGAAKTQEPVAKKDKPNAEERIRELAAEVKQLRERVRTREAAPEPTPIAKPAEKAPEPPKRPSLLTWMGTEEEFETAQDAYEAHFKQQTLKEVEQQQAIQRANAAFAKDVAAAKERYPEFETVANAASETLQTAPNDIKAWLNRSPFAMDLIYTIGGTEESLSDFMTTAKADPLAAMRKLAFMEIEIANALNKPKGDKPAGEAAVERGPDGKFVAAKATEPATAAAPANPKPSAPKPPSEVGGRGVAPEDDRAAAARAGDFRAFKAGESRRLAASR